MTKEDFNKKLNQYASTEGHIDSLVKRLQKEGFNRLNYLLLDKAIEKLPKKAKSITPITAVIALSDNNIGNEGDALAIEMRRLIGEKNRLSNSFFDYQDNASKCKSISVQVLSLEATIEQMREKLRYFNEHGKMPESPKNEAEDKLPDTKYELSKKAESIRVMIKQVEQEIETAAVQGDQNKVKKREKRLLELKNLRDVVQKKFAEAKI